MIQINMSQYMEIELERRLEQIRKEAAQNRLASQAMKKTNTQKSTHPHILARIGKGMASLGSSLEERYGDQPADTCFGKPCEYV